MKRLTAARILLEPLEPICYVVLAPQSPMDASDIDCFQGTSALQAVRLNGPLSTHGWKSLGCLSQLMAVDLEYCGPGPTDGDFESLSQLPRLQSLTCRQVTVDTAGFGHLSRTGNLDSLFIDNVKSWSVPFDRTLPRELWPQPNDPAEFSADAFRQMAKSVTLSVLSVIECPGFRDEHLLALTSPLPDGGEPLPNLQQLRLSGTGITSCGLARLGNFPKLRLLDLAGTNIEDGGMRALTRIQSLRRLNLRGTQVSDNGAAILAEMRLLESLAVPGTRISEKGLLQFIAISGLRSLVVSKTVTEETLLKLRSHFPCYQDNAL